METLKKLEDVNVQQNWITHYDELTLEALTIRSNFNDWEIAKSKLNKAYPFNAPFYLLTNNAAALTLKQAKVLRDYLNEKIDYLEAE